MMAHPPRIAIAVVLLIAAAATPAAAQSPADEVLKYFCEVAEKKEVEDMATAAVCHAVADEVPIPGGKAACLPLLREGWERLAGECPPSPNGTVAVVVKTPALDPSPPDVVIDLLCKLAKNADAKKQTTGEFCDALKQYIQFNPPEACEQVLGMAWDYLASQCPNSAIHEGPTPEMNSLVV